MRQRVQLMYRVMVLVVQRYLLVQETVPDIVVPVVCIKNILMVHGDIENVILTLQHIQIRMENVQLVIVKYQDVDYIRARVHVVDTVLHVVLIKSKMEALGYVQSVIIVHRRLTLTDLVQVVAQIVTAVLIH